MRRNLPNKVDENGCFVTISASAPLRKSFREILCTEIFRNSCTNMQSPTWGGLEVDGRWGKKLKRNS
jgi:hypothetical protein